MGAELWGIQERMNEAQEFLRRVVELSASEGDFCKVRAVAGEVWVHTEENLDCRFLEHAGPRERPLPCRGSAHPHSHPARGPPRLAGVSPDDGSLGTYLHPPSLWQPDCSVKSQCSLTGEAWTC